MTLTLLTGTCVTVLLFKHTVSLKHNKLIGLMLFEKIQRRYSSNFLNYFYFMNNHYTDKIFLEDNSWKNKYLLSIL